MNLITQAIKNNSKSVLGVLVPLAVLLNILYLVLLGINLDKSEKSYEKNTQYVETLPKETINTELDTVIFVKEDNNYKIEYNLDKIDYTSTVELDKVILSNITRPKLYLIDDLEYLVLPVKYTKDMLGTELDYLIFYIALSFTFAIYYLLRVTFDFANTETPKLNRVFMYHISKITIAMGYVALVGFITIRYCFNYT